MKKLITTLTLLIVTLTMTAQAPAFPGAEGHGRYTTGGRGGKIVHVTNLNDSGDGSFRQAVSGSDKKIVVFDVGGVIALKKDLTIGANTTILGQTAPAPGITLRYYTLKPNGNNIIIRFLRVRRGEERDVNDGADALFVRHQSNLLFDHCSFSWSIDETLSCYDNKNFTAQWCTIGEGLNLSGHNKGPHGYGGIWGGKGASFHHNLIIHENNRTPRLNGARYNWSGYDQTKYANSVQAEQVDLRNNVMYNWGDGNGAYGGMGGYHNIVNNYYKAGPATSNKTRIFQCSTNSSSDSDGALPDGLPGRFYINGNYTANNNRESFDWSGVIQDKGTGVTVVANGGSTYVDSKGIYGPAGATVALKLTSQNDPGTVTTHTAKTAYEKVLAYCGASLHRDCVDARYMDETKNGTATYKGTVLEYDVYNEKNKTTTHYTLKESQKRAGIIDRVADQGTYSLESTSRPADFDADGDGIADAWEQANGGDLTANGYDLDPNKYYTNIEVYANSLVQDIMLAGNADATDAVKEYYPAYKKADGTEVAAINGDGQEVTPDDPTQEGDTEVIYFWEEGLTTSNAVTLSDGTTLQITGNTSKTLSAGKTIAVDGRDYTSFKISNGAQNTVTLPSGKTAQSVTFYSYVNKSTSEAADRESYWAEVNGTTYTAETSGGLMKSFTDMSNYQSNPDVSTTFPLGGATSFTFKNAGYQPCLVMKVVFGNGTTTGISELRKVSLTGEAYNLSGQKVGAGYKGIVICNGRKQIQR